MRPEPDSTQHPEGAKATDAGDKSPRTDPTDRSVQAGGRPEAVSGEATSDEAATGAASEAAAHSDRTVHAEKRSAPTKPDHSEAAILMQYQTLQQTISNIMSELWQTTAFFTSFTAVALGAILANWSKFLRMPVLASIGITAGLLYMMAIWYITTLKHNVYSELHLRHARELEELVPDLTLYTRRAGVKTRLPSVRKLWLTAPIVFASAIVILEVSRMAGVN